MTVADFSSMTLGLAGCGVSHLYAQLPEGRSKKI